MTEKKPQQKELSFEHAARAIQTDITGLGEAVKKGFESIRNEMGDDVGQLTATLQDINGNFEIENIDVRVSLAREDEFK